MKKVVLFLGVLFLGGFFLAADAISINIVAPPSGIPLIKNSTETITWTHSSHFNTNPQDCRIYFGGHAISGPIPVTACSFTWTVGRKADGTYIPQGIYYLTIQSPLYNTPNGPQRVLVDEDALIRFVTPPNNTNTTLTRGQTYVINWTHSAYYHVVPQTCTVFCDTHFISPPIPVLDDTFIWTVGQDKDGNAIPAGQYQMVIESDDHDEFGPTITLVDVPVPGSGNIPEIFKQISDLRIERQPGVCIVCFELLLKNLRSKLLKVKPTCELRLYKDNRLVAKLGKFGGRSRLPEKAGFKLNKMQAEKLNKKGQGYFQLKVFGTRGKLLHTQRVLLKLATRRIKAPRKR